MNIAGSAFLYLALAASAGALAFLSAQRLSGRTPPQVERVHEHAALLESVGRDLRALVDEAEKAPPSDDGRADLRSARDGLDDAIAGLRRGADVVV